MLVERILGGPTVREGLHLVAGPLEIQADNLGDAGLVFDNGNLGHGKIYQGGLRSKRRKSYANLNVGETRDLRF